MFLGSFWMPLGSKTQQTGTAARALKMGWQLQRSGCALLISDEYELSTPRKQIVVVGAGGHAKVVIEAIWAMDEFEIVGVVDPKPADAEVLGVSVLGGDEELPRLLTLGVT